MSRLLDFAVVRSLLLYLNNSSRFDDAMRHTDVLGRQGLPIYAGNFRGEPARMA
jgi:hypothetical protein